jgi:hypothetical protein
MVYALSLGPLKKFKNVIQKIDKNRCDTQSYPSVTRQTSRSRVRCVSCHLQIELLDGLQYPKQQALKNIIASIFRFATPKISIFHPIDD